LKRQKKAKDKGWERQGPSIVTRCTKLGRRGEVVQLDGSREGEKCPASKPGVVQGEKRMENILTDGGGWKKKEQREGTRPHV